MNYNVFQVMKRRFLEWAGGSPPITDEVYRSIKKEYHVILYCSGIFPDLRPEYRVFNVLLIVAQISTLVFYQWLFIVTFTIKIEEDFSSAAPYGGLILLNGFGVFVVALFNIHRQDLINSFHLMSVGYCDCNDNKQISDIQAEINKSRRQKLFIIIITAAGLLLAGVVTASGRTMDIYAGVVPNSAYIGDVYMLTPVPMWYPFKVTSEFWHYLVVFTQLLDASFLTCACAGERFR